jgi:hypothetical protein
MKAKNKKVKKIHWVLPFCLWVVMGGGAVASPVGENVGDVSPVVNEAVMCEKILDGLPVNQTIIFNVSKTSAYCWSRFDPVPADGVVYHEWYRKGMLITRKKLAVHTPRWATYSRLPLRQADIGPWRLDITDENGNVLKTLRFSVTE